MTIPPTPVDPDRVGSVAQIIVASLMMGVILFAAVVLITPPQPAGDMAVLEYAALGAAGLLLAARAVVPGLLASAQVRQVMPTNPADLRQPLAGVYMSRTIIGGALLEGAAFINLVAYMINRHWSNIGMAGFLVIVMAVTFPSQSQFETWVDQVRRDHV